MQHIMFKLGIHQNMEICRFTRLEIGADTVRPTKLTINYKGKQSLMMSIVYI
jgi:hypothetical protein